MSAIRLALKDLHPALWQEFSLLDSFFSSAYSPVHIPENKRAASEKRYENLFNLFFKGIPL